MFNIRHLFDVYVYIFYITSGTKRSDVIFNCVLDQFNSVKMINKLKSQPETSEDNFCKDNFFFPDISPNVRQYNVFFVMWIFMY